MADRITKAQARELYESGWWVGHDDRSVVTFQMHEPLLCMPFVEFHEAMERTLGRPVLTHEFGLDWHGLQCELLGDRPVPTRDDLLALLPEERRRFVMREGS
jgi:hypothetical protein